MFNEKFLTRQYDLIPVEVLDKKIIVIGAGAIGGFTVMALAKMGFSNIEVWDDDVVDTENMNCQFYKVSDIGRNKVDALKDQIREFMGIEIATRNERVTEMNVDEVSCDILITAVDNMATRSLLYTEACFSFIIDPRMSAEYATLDVLSAEKASEAKLFSDSEAIQERCTAKSTMYTVLLISGQVAKVVIDICLKRYRVKSLDWDIAKNKLIAFGQDGELL